MKTLVVKFDKKKRVFRVVLREWYFQGDRPDYEEVGYITLRMLADAMEEAGVEVK
jgi:hypothetical protein